VICALILRLIAALLHTQSGCSASGHNVVHHNLPA
jgi:hypothetical protein